MDKGLHRNSLFGRLSRRKESFHNAMIISARASGSITSYLYHARACTLKSSCWLMSHCVRATEEWNIGMLFELSTLQELVAMLGGEDECCAELEYQTAREPWNLVCASGREPAEPTFLQPQQQRTSIWHLTPAKTSSTPTNLNCTDFKSLRNLKFSFPNDDSSRFLNNIPDKWDFQKCTAPSADAQAI